MPDPGNRRPPPDWPHQIEVARPSPPEAYGDPDCPECHGRGRFDVPPEERLPGPPALRMCRCVLLREIIANVERGMRGLPNAAKVPSSPLTALVDANAWITADPAWFTAHLRHVAVRKPPRWGFQVVTDADLMQAWLATAAAGGYEILDPDVAGAVEKRSLSHMTLVDIALPPVLLVVRLGVKSARNVAMSEVLLEAIRMRWHEGAPTWLWDQPDHPLDAEDHRCWSPLVMEEIASWHRLRGKERRAQPASPSPARPSLLVEDATPADEDTQDVVRSAGRYDGTAALDRALSGSSDPRPPNKRKKKLRGGG